MPPPAVARPAVFQERANEFDIDAIQFNVQPSSRENCLKAQRTFRNIVGARTSIQELTLNPNDDYRKKFLVAMIVGITNGETRNVRAKGHGGRGMDMKKSYDRAIKLFDPTSAEGMNMVTILTGASCSSNFFRLDSQARDNGSFSTYNNLLFICPLNKIILPSYNPFSKSFRSREYCVPTKAIWNHSNHC